MIIQSSGINNEMYLHSGCGYGVRWGNGCGDRYECGDGYGVN